MKNFVRFDLSCFHTLKCNIAGTWILAIGQQTLQLVLNLDILYWLLSCCQVALPCSYNIYPLNWESCLRVILPKHVEMPTPPRYLFDIAVWFLILFLCHGINWNVPCLSPLDRDVQVAYGLWFIAEVAIASTDLAEVIGSAVALNLLFGLPIWAGVLITAADVLFIILFGIKNFRLIEILVMLLCMVITGCFAYEVGAAKPNWAGVASGFIPKGKIVTNTEILYAAIGILGATVMPHNLFLHSSIVQVCIPAFILHELLMIAHDPVLPSADLSFCPFSARKKVCSEVCHNRQSPVSALGFLRECCHADRGQCSIPLWQKPKLNSG